MRDDGGLCPCQKWTLKRACTNSIRLPSCTWTHGHACTPANVSYERAPPRILHMRVVRGICPQTKRPLRVHARSWRCLPSCTWTKWPRMHYCNCEMLPKQQREVCGLRPDFCTGGMLEGSARGRSRHLPVPPQARSLGWLARRTWTKWPRLHDGCCWLLRGIRPTHCTG